MFPLPFGEGVRGRGDSRMIDPFPLLALCARAQGTPEIYAQLRQRARALSSWDDVPAQAEAHGLEPLLYTHLQAANVALPPHVQQQLQVRTMQHAHANRVRFTALAEILDAFQSAGIPALVLKGAALAHLVYAHPGWRVMRDLDVLVSTAEAQRAHMLLAQMGFCVPLFEREHIVRHKHLPVMQREVEGMLISVEVHYNLYSKETPAAAFEALWPAAIPFAVDGVPAYALGYEDMLEHVYRHAMEDMIFKPLRLIWVADLVSLAEQYALTIDWNRVAPAVRRALAVLHWLTPLSEELRAAAALDIGAAPRGIEKQSGWDFQGWPRSSLAAQRDKGYLGILRDTFYPPEGWLRLYYGLGRGADFWWGRLVRHPWCILGWVGNYLIGKQ